MGSAWNLRRWTAVAVLALALAGCGGGEEAAAPATTTVPEPAAEAAPEEATSADEVASDRTVARAARRAARDLGRAGASDAWAVPDAVLAPLDTLWSDRLGAYLSPGGVVSTRLNAELLRIHAAAARAGHTGPSRRDDRIGRIAAYLTGPAYIADVKGVRFGGSRHNSIHVPGWRESSDDVVNQHQSIDAAVARALRETWLVRDRVRVPATTQARIRRTVAAVAASPTFAYPGRLLNQINWNAELYAAAATITGNPAPLRDDYRRQLTWFADHAHRPIAKGAQPNLSTGLGFYYQPEDDARASVNRSDTVEYANTVLGALRYYDEAVAAGMQPLSGSERRTLKAWARHTLRADWAPSGYLNWETGKGASRVHLRQYWALALDGAVNAATGGSRLIGTEPAEGDRLLARGVALFRRWAADTGTVLLPPTAFGFPSAFENVKENRTTASVRLAAAIAEWAADCGCSGQLPPADPQQAQLVTAYDPGFRRLAVNGPRYATAISPVAAPTGGGLEPAWILDERATPLTALGGGGDGSLGLRVDRSGAVLLDTQPGLAGAANLSLAAVLGQDDAYTGVVSGAGADVRVTHEFRRDEIVTRYVVDPTVGVRVTLRVPSAGREGTVRCTARPAELIEVADERLPGCQEGQDYLVRSDGANMHVDFAGLPRRARVALSRPAARSTAPRPGQQATVRFRVTKRTTFERILRPLGR